MGGKSQSRSRSRSRSRRKKRDNKHDERRERDNKHDERRERDKHDERRGCGGGATMREIEQSGLGTGAEKKHQNLRHLSKRGGGVRILSKQKLY